MASHPRKLIQDENFPVEDDKFPSGLITHTIHWSQGNKKRVPITCGWCGQKMEVSRTRALEIRQEVIEVPQNWRCRECFENPQLFMNKLSTHSHQAEAVILTDIKEKRSRGRQKGVKYIDPKASRVSLENAVRMLWARSQSVGAINYPAVAKVFQSAGERIGADAVRKRFNECVTGQKWRDFVVSIVGQNGN
jgi:hypothetical protein